MRRWIERKSGPVILSRMAPDHITMTAIADLLVYIIWLPLLIGARESVSRLNRWAGVSHDRIERMPDRPTRPAPLRLTTTI